MRPLPGPCFWGRPWWGQHGFLGTAWVCPSGLLRTSGRNPPRAGGLQAKDKVSCWVWPPVISGFGSKSSHLTNIPFPQAHTQYTTAFSEPTHMHTIVSAYLTALSNTYFYNIYHVLITPDVYTISENNCRCELTHASCNTHTRW